MGSIAPLSRHAALLDELSAGKGSRRTEGLAFAVALAAHVVLLVALTVSAPGKKPVPAPERMTITFSDEIADQSTSPDPMAQSMPDVAPELGEAPPAPEPQPQVQPQPQPAPPQPAPRVQPQPQLQPRPAPAPAKPQPPKPTPAKAAPRPVAQPVAKAPAKPASAAPAARPADTRDRRRPDAPAGGSRIGNDFLKGIPAASAPGTSRNQPAATLGSAERASLAGAIARQLKSHWAAPQGADADKLVTILAWDLNPDGTLAGAPRLVRQEGITDANRAQAQRHVEQAIRAVRLAAPFNLPNQYYSGWKRIAAFRFDRKLSQ